MEIEKSVKCLQHEKLTNIIVWVLRIAVGITFIYSGFVKTIDPWGFIFKLEEYCAVAGVTLPRSITLVTAITISGFEFISGLLLFTGAYKRMIPWLMTLLMAVMLPLTMWLWLANPISDCGCFGDAVKMSNGATFLKNVILTAALIYLIFYNRKVKSCVFNSAAQWLEIVVSMIYIVSIALISYNVQPLIDFRPYPEGRSLTEAATDDDEKLLFRYTNGTTTRDFTIDSLPDDSTWTFVERIEPDGGVDSRSTFTIFNGDEDVTDDVILNDGKQLILVIPEMERADISNTYFINQLYRMAQPHDIEFTGLLATDSEGIDYWRDISMAEYDCYTVEDTSLKELVRGNIALVYLEDGTIKWKRTVSSLDIATAENAEKQYGDDFINHVVDDSYTMLRHITGIYLITLIVLWLLQFVIGRIIRLQRAKALKK